MWRMISILLTILLSYPSGGKEEFVDVIAVEFPPISSLSIKDAGLAFQLLRQHTPDSAIHWVPLFLPPGRAAYTIKSGEWCASFYPVFDESSSQVIRLSQMPLRFGLIRMKKPSKFEWDSYDEFASKSIAVLRGDEDIPLYRSLTDAGARLAFVEKFQTGAQMVLLGRTEMALVDELTYINMEQNNKAKLQFSQRPLVEMHIDLYLNNNCADRIMPFILH